MQLHDGKRLIRSDRFELIKQELNMTDAQMFEKGILKIHPDFRIIALAEPPIPNAGTKNWMSPEILSLFAFHEMRMLTKQEEMHIITSKVCILFELKYLLIFAYSSMVLFQSLFIR